MMTLPINQSQIAHTTAEWAALSTYIIGLDVIGIEVMTNGYNRFKRGDGVTAWESLAYLKREYAIPIDDTPTEGSDNPLSSGGAYDAFALKANKAQPSLLIPTLISPWTNYGSATYADAGYYKDEMGRVHCVGMVKGGTGGTVFTFVAGYRPAKNFFRATVSNGAFCAFQVYSNGEVHFAVTPSSAWVDLSAIDFLAEA